jgi:hypothetical protein
MQNREAKFSFAILKRTGGEAEESRMLRLLQCSDHNTPEETARRRDRKRSCVVAIDSERRTFDPIEILTSALRSRQDEKGKTALISERQEVER